MVLSTQQVLQQDDNDLWNTCDHSVRTELANFIKEFNKREYSVRVGKTYSTFDEYAQKEYPKSHRDEFKIGFVVDGRPIPYFHPNRSFHDEIIWLNNNLYYDTEVSFENKLVNSAIVKFYGPSRTLDIITGYADDLPYLRKTEKPYIQFDRLLDVDYEYTLIRNIESAFYNKEQIWGTTELRTSLQIAARNYSRENRTQGDTKDLVDLKTGKIIRSASNFSSDRKMSPSDMICWIKSLADGWINFYKTKPSMKESYEFLTQIRGIGPYYGYHFSSNLARMPGVGSSSLIEREHSKAFAALNIDHGNIDENADYVVAGPGACATLKRLWPNATINPATTMHMILSIRDNQHKYFDIFSDMDYKYMSESTELGQFTTFGVEIACCQFNVFSKLKDNYNTALARANAPISKEVGNAKASIESFLS